jgi:ferredoxin
VVEMSWKVVVDFDRCESNALCMAAAPEVFEVRDDNFLYVLQDEPPDTMRASVEEAVRLCPKQAISIAEE